MRRVSPKRARENRQRVAMLKAKYGPGPVLCEECGNREATDPHEPLTRARGGSITDPGNVRALCRWCHERAHRENRLEHSWDAR